MKTGKKLLFITLCIYFTAVLSQSMAQTVLVRDLLNQRPVDNVAIFNQGYTRTALTNVYGLADISLFSESDTLFFQHAAYVGDSLAYADISGMGFNIFLERKMISLKEVTVSATRFEEDVRNVPNRIVSITADEIAFDNPRSAADLLAESGEVFVQKSQFGGGSPMIRGFSANKVLIVVDGVRMNNAIFRGGNLHNVISLDPAAIERTDIIFGPGTVIYGSDALGGVMNFTTIRPPLSTDGKFHTDLNFFGRYSSASNERSGHLDIRLSGKKWASVTSFSNYWFDDLRMGRNGPDEYLRRHYVRTEGGIDQMVVNTEPEIQRFSGYDQMNLMQKFRFMPNSRLDITYGFHYSETSDIPRYDRLIQYGKNDTLRYASWYYGPQKWMMNVLNSSMMLNTRMITEMKVTLAWQRFEESRHSRKFNDPWFSNQSEKVDMYTANIDIEKRLDAKNKLYYGFEGMLNNIVSAAFDRNFMNGEEKVAGTRYPDGSNKYQSGAFYANYEHLFSDKLVMFAGARYNYIKLNSVIDDTVIYHFPFNEISIQTAALNGSAGISWRPAEPWQFSANLSTGFRAPNLDDAGKVFDSSPGNVVVPNPDLKPEYAYSADGAVERTFADIASLEFSAFYTYLQNAMVRRHFVFNGMDSILYNGELSQVEAIVNAASAEIFGFSAAARLSLGEYFSVRSSITWMDGADNEGYAMRHVSPLFGITALEIELGPVKSEISVVYNGEIPYSRLAPDEREKAFMYAKDHDGNPYSPAWWTLNFRASWKLVEQLMLDLGVENIFDKGYRPYSSGIVAPGRNFIIALRAKI